MEPFLIIIFSDDRQPLESWVKRIELGKLESYVHDLLESLPNAGGIIATSIDLTMDGAMTAHVEHEVWLPWVR